MRHLLAKFVPSAFKMVAWRSVVFYEMLLLYVIAGSLGGLLIGLIGMGIGPIVVPMMIFCLPMIGVNSTTAVHIAVCTSLIAISVTTLFSLIAHHFNNSVNWPIFYRLLPGSLIGAALGSCIVILLTGQALKIIFGVFLVLLGIYMFIPFKNSLQRAWPGVKKLFCISTLIAMVSNLLGIGDGVLMVPFLKRYNITMTQAVGTATALIVPVSFMGVIPLFIAGLHDPHIPTFSFGYIYLPAFVVITICSIVFSLIGVRLAKRSSERVLRMIFALSVILIGGKMIFSVM